MACDFILSGIFKVSIMLNVTLLSVNMPSVIFLSVILLRFIILSVMMLSVIMLRVLIVVFTYLASLKGANSNKYSALLSHCNLYL